MKNKKFIFIFLVFLALLPIVVSLTNLPPGLVQLLEEQERQVAAMNYLVALVGGVIALLSPCILSIIPAFLAIAFKERKNLTKTFGIFLLGVSLVLALFALGGVGLGRFLRLIRFEMVLFVGLVFLVWAVFIFLGKHFIFKPNKHGNDVWGTLTFGILFAIGYTPCVFPVSAAILVIGNSVAGSFNAAMLMFMYSIGIFLPMMIVAVLYDYFRLSETKWMQANYISFGKLKIRITNIIAGLIFLFFGLLFVLYRGTYIFNAVDPIESMVLVSFGQKWLLNLGISPMMGNILGIVLLALLGYWFWFLTEKVFRKEGL
ncbi:MAG: cytochrome c biogenesis protein CcdA [Candidatus Woesearchaeota archaeon]|nr:cytochrome c biogenesis protein CcdA [Candidatus Woesearchaeota archaeon]